jgi:hypothetical protein
VVVGSIPASPTTEHQVTRSLVHFPSKVISVSGKEYEGWGQPLVLRPGEEVTNPGLKSETWATHQLIGWLHNNAVTVLGGPSAILSAGRRQDQRRDRRHNPPPRQLRPTPDRRGRLLARA